MAVYISKISKESGDALAHYGVLGMKWGVRRYQNKDGSYTKAGLERYRKEGINLKQVHDGRFLSEYDAYGLRVESSDVNEEMVRLGDRSVGISDRITESYKYAEQSIGEVKASAVKKEAISQLKKDLISPSNVDDMDLIQLDAEDAVERIFFKQAKSTPSGKKAASVENEINDYFDDVAKTTEKLVQAHGGERIIGFDKSKQTQYSNVVRQTLLSSQVGGLGRIARHGIFEDTLYNSDEYYKRCNEITEQVISEFMKLK